jgi:hypothetical protein
MKTSRQQSKAFRQAFWAEAAREAYLAAKRGGEFDLALLEVEAAVEAESHLIDLSQYAPVPSSEGWQDLGA